MNEFMAVRNMLNPCGKISVVKGYHRNFRVLGTAILYILAFSVRSSHSESLSSHLIGFPLDPSKSIEEAFLSPLEKNSECLSCTGFNTASPKIIRPKFILHIGPRKTGSSTIQCSLPRYVKPLQNDNFEYIGKASRRCQLSNVTAIELETKKHFIPTQSVNTLVQCMIDKQTSSCPEWRDFTNTVRENRMSGRNVLFSAEQFDGFDLMEGGNLEPLVSFLRNDGDGWDVKIVMVYRRYHEWIVSAYHEKYRVSDHNPKFYNWSDSSGNELAVPSFAEFYEDRLNEHNAPYHRDPIGYLKQAYERVFDDVVVMNMHDQGDLLERFVCDIIPGLEHTCAKRKEELLEEKDKGEGGEIVENRSFEPHYDILAMEAYRNNMLNMKSGPGTRVFVRNAIRTYAEEHKMTYANDFPHHSDSKLEEELLNMSLSIEKNIFPEYFVVSSDNRMVAVEEEHRETFRIASQQGKFATMDVKKTIGEKRWKDFFINL